MSPFLVVLHAKPFVAQSLPPVTTRSLTLSRQPSSVVFALPPLPKGTGAPRGQRDAGSRGCAAAPGQRLTALVPFYPATGSVFGWTTAERPTFWFYVPYFPANTYGRLTLEQANNQQVAYTVPLSGTPGVIQVALPPTAATLSIGQPYRWYFNIYCQERLAGSIYGVIQRETVSTRMKSDLTQAAARDRLLLYAANGFWFDALALAAEQRRINAQDASWASLLEAVDLQGLAQEPVVSCCQLR
ncbi:MAG: DUF928 domain-containing protein [Leptolyngbyaceae cyanobacterium bins.349]|nr:DUF928 domain-containing protein [Leptolyngbyaceae cyanobacterium bins.349]